MHKNKMLKNTPCQKIPKNMYVILDTVDCADWIIIQI